jgi:hypothetical protein
MNVANQEQIVGALPHGSPAKAALAVAAAVLILLTSAITWIAFETLSTRTTGDAAQTTIGTTIPNSGLVEFRRGEQGASEVVAAGGTTLDPGLVEFRRGEQGSSASGDAGNAAPDGALEEFRRGERGG